MTKEPRGGAEKSSTVPVGRGLYALRYVSSAERVAPPVVFFRALPASANVIRVISAPGQPEGRLEAPGVCAVIVADQAGEIELTIRSADPGVKLDAVLNLDRLSSDEIHFGSEAPRSSEGLREAPSSYVAAGNVDALLLVAAHVSRRGDVVGRAGEWIGGPKAPTPIEGIEIRVAERLRDAIEYQALGRGGWSEWARPGVFLGSRGQATPLRGLRLRVSPHRPDVSLEGEALFLGAPIVRREGGYLDFVALAEADPLVGLKLSAFVVEPVQSKTKVEPSSGSAEPTKKGPSEPPKKKGVKIFKRRVIA